MEILKVDPFKRFGTPVEIIQLFGGKPETSRRHAGTGKTICIH